MQTEHSEESARVLVQLTDPQFDLVTTEKQFPAMVAGFGAGKTGALIKRILAKKFQYPDLNVAYYLPTYDLVTTIAIPRFEEALAEMGYMPGGRNPDYRINKSEKMIHIDGCGSVIMRTMDNPGRIVGYEVADSCIDELDTLKEVDARNVWQKILARNRQKKPDGASNTIAVGTTPEGFKFVYDRWEKNPPSDQYYKIEASTYSNARNLPAGYIDDLIADYPTALIQAYLMGKFVNLTSGSVYPDFDRELNRSNATIRAGEPLHIGMDFNVGKMSGVVFVNREGFPHAVEELSKILDTPTMIEAIKRRFPNHPIFIYPDASGGARKTNNASVSDLALLRQADFTVLNNPSNPLVRDRVLAVNIMICAGIGSLMRRRLFVNPDTCPAFAEGLEKQAYNDKGEPDKSSGLDHAVDAGGYFISYRYPVVGGKVQKVKVGGI